MDAPAPVDPARVAPPGAEPRLAVGVGVAVGVVGTGRVGAVLGAALARAGHPVVAASGTSGASRERAERLLPGVPLRSAVEVARAGELLLLAVPDDALPGLVTALAQAGALRPGQVVVHPSGRHGLAVLEPAARAGALPLALHPVLPFTGGADDLPRLRGACFGVTAPAGRSAAGEAVVLRLGGVPVPVAEELRPLWHAALAHGANHLVTLVASAADLLRAAGAAEPQAVLAPLLTAALQGALQRGDDALTGPVARGDRSTVVAHLGALPDAVRPAYAALARLTASRAVASGRLREEQAQRLLEVL